MRWQRIAMVGHGVRTVAPRSHPLLLDVGGGGTKEGATELCRNKIEDNVVVRLEPIKNHCVAPSSGRQLREDDINALRGDDAFEPLKHVELGILHINLPRREQRAV